ncbi:MAG: TlpA family protein disulfide reductase [Actinomycetota bacterium]
MRSRILLLLVATSLGVSCASDPRSPEAAGTPADSVECPTQYQDVDAYPVFVSSEVTSTETNRFLIGLLSGDNDAPIAAPEIELNVGFTEVDGPGAIPAEDAEFLWTVEGERGLYKTEVDFPSPGRWAAQMTVSGPDLDEDVTGCFDVTESGSTPALGSDAPPSATATAKDGQNLSKISTAQDPNPRFYEVSVADALEEGEPFVLVFATPKYCASAVCGPTLEDVESVAKDYPDLTFIHSEIYVGLEPSDKVLPAVSEWGLPSEPWVFVVDADGKVVAKFEGAAPPEELRSALDAL